MASTLTNLHHRRGPRQAGTGSETSNRGSRPRPARPVVRSGTLGIGDERRLSVYQRSRAVLATLRGPVVPRATSGGAWAGGASGAAWTFAWLFRAASRLTLNER